MLLKNKIISFLVLMTVVFSCSDFDDVALDNSLVENMNSKIDFYYKLDMDSTRHTDLLSTVFLERINDSLFIGLEDGKTFIDSFKTTTIKNEFIDYVTSSPTLMQTLLDEVSIKENSYLIDISHLTDPTDDIEPGKELEIFPYIVFKTSFQVNDEIDILLDDFFSIEIVEVKSDLTQVDVILDREWSIEELSVNTINNYLDLTSLNVNEKKENLIFKERARFIPDTSSDYYIFLKNDQKNIRSDSLQCVITNY